MLEVVRDIFDISIPRMHQEIRAMHAHLLGALQLKQIEYANLKPALIPSIDRNEAGFLFDSQEINSWYGYAVAEQIIPLLDKRTTQSILCGDLLGDNQETIFDILNEHMVLARSFEFIHGTGIYCVYLNNLSDAAIKRIHEGLCNYGPYLGYLPATYQTRAKTYLSTTLVNSCVKYRDTILMGHEDDRPDSEDVNMTGYPY